MVTLLEAYDDEGEETMLSRNVCNHLPVEMVQHPRSAEPLMI
jgi:hypothetical protein